MNSPIPWIQVTIPGVLYVATGFVVFLCFQGKYDLDFPRSIGTYLPYIAVAAAFLSYVVGFSAHLIMHKIISWLWPSTKATAAQLTALWLLPPPVQHEYGTIYSNLVMFRLLVAGFTLLEISLFFWVPKSSLADPHAAIYYVCPFFFVLFSFAYCIWRNIYIGYGDDLRTRYPGIH
jgi:hypothetical protein